MNYEKDIIIDETALDIEWLNQPRLFMKYAKNAAQTRANLDQAKEALDITKSEVDADIREHPEKFGVAKVTETAIQGAIVLDSRFKKANKVYLDAKYEADIAQSAVQAMNQRKDALENMVKLFGMKYFAGPEMPRDLPFELKQKEAQEASNVSVARKLQRSRS